MALIVCEQLHLTYGLESDVPIEALHGIDLTIESGRRVALIGSNGAGKSTIVKAINGLLPTRAGTIAWDGATLGAMRASDRTRAGIGTVPEGRMLFPDIRTL